MVELHLNGSYKGIGMSAEDTPQGAAGRTVEDKWEDVLEVGEELFGYKFTMMTKQAATEVASILELNRTTTAALGELAEKTYLKGHGLTREERLALRAVTQGMAVYHLLKELETIYLPPIRETNPALADRLQQAIVAPLDYQEEDLP